MLRKVLGRLVCGGEPESDDDDDDDPVITLADERKQLTPVETRAREPQAEAPRGREESGVRDALEVTTRAGIAAAMLRLRMYQEERLAREFALARPRE